MERLARMPMRSPRRTGAYLFLGNVVVAAILVIATFLDLDANRLSQMARATEAVDNLARSLSVELASEFHLVENALATIARSGQWDRGLVSSPQALLQEQAALLPFARAIRIEARSLGATNAGPGVGGSDIDAAGPDYLAQLRASQVAMVSEPVFCKTVGEWCVLVARRMEISGHDREGVVYAVLSAKHFQSLFSNFSVGAAGAISLRSDSMRMAARYSAADPASSVGLGSSEVSAELTAALRHNRQAGSYVTSTSLDNVERINAYRRVPGYPFTVVAGYSAASYLAPWRDSSRRHWSFTAAVVVLVGLGSWLLYRLHARQHQICISAAQLAREQHAILDNDLVGMLRVRERKIQWANAAVTRILGRPREAVVGAELCILYPDAQSYATLGAEGHESIRHHGRYRVQREIRHPDGCRLWVDISAAAVGHGESIWLLVDINQLKRSEEAARQLSLHDPLTELANRRLFEALLQQGLAQSRRASKSIAVCFMDLDGFKAINDTHGHDAGDQVLREVARRLRTVFRANDSMARLGGDEFAWFLSDVGEQGEVVPALQRCIESVHLPIVLDNGTVVAVGCSIGVALDVPGDTAAAQLTKAADKAMYQAKQSGRGRYAFAEGHRGLQILPR